MAKQLFLTLVLIFQSLVPTTLKAQLSVDLRGQVGIVTLHSEQMLIIQDIHNDFKSNKKFELKSQFTMTS